MSAAVDERPATARTTAAGRPSRKGAWRVPLRMARRTAWREKGRALLVVLMIGLPVGAVAAASIAVATEAEAHLRSAKLALGAADLRLEWAGSAVTGQSITAESLQSDGPSTGVVPSPTADLPPGSRVIARRSGAGSLTYQGRPFRGVNATELDLGDPMLAGTIRVLSGRLPRQVGEAVVTPRLAERLSLQSGSTVSIVGGASVTVVGVVESTSTVDHRGELMAPPGSLGLSSDHLDAPQWFATTPRPLTVAEISALNAKGWLVLSAALLAHPPAWCSASGDYCTGTTDWSNASGSFSYGSVDNGTATVIALATVMALLQVVLLVGPAFAVGLRRRRRDLGLLAVTGARPAQLRRVVLAEGVVIGAIGAVSGVVLAWLVVWGFSGQLEQTGAPRWIGLPTVSPLVLVVLVVGVLTAVVAALAPARQAAQTDAASAVGRGASRTATRRSRRAVVIGGLLAVGLGSALVVHLALTEFGLGSSSSQITLLVGLIVAELGVVALAPTLVALVAARAGRLPLTPRLAARDAARNRLRSGAAVAAVTAAVAGSVASLLYFASMDAIDARTYQPMMRANLVSVSLDGATTPAELAAVRAALARTLPALRTWPLVDLPMAGDEGQGLQPGVEVVVPLASQCPPDGAAAAPSDATASGPSAAGVGASVGASAPTSAPGPAAVDPRCDDQRRYSPKSPLGYQFTYLVADADALAAATGQESAPARAALDRGGAVVFSKYLIDNGQVSLRVWKGSDPTKAATSQQTFVTPGALVGDGPVPAAVIVSPALALRLGVAPNRQVVLATTSRTPTGAEADAANAAVTTITGDDTEPIQYEAGRPRDAHFYLLLGIVFLAIAIGAAASISAAGLALADSRSDLATLAAVGAPPRVRRRLAAWQAGVLTLLWSALGLAAGILPGWAMVHLTGDASRSVEGVQSPAQLVVPWGWIAAVALGFPIVTSAVVWLAAGSRAVLVRRTD